MDYSNEDIMRLTIRLDEALKALEQIEQQLDYGQVNMALHIARRALTEGKEWRKE